MWSSSARRGQLIVEMLLALGMLSLLLVLVFGAFGMSTRIFTESTLRQSAEQQLKTVRVLLERDIELTNFWLANVVTRPVSGGRSRDALSMVGLSEWNNASLFQSDTQRPAWDRQLIWYATTESPGRLIRQVAAPPTVAPSPYLNQPYAALGENLAEASPEGNKNVLSTRYLSAGVLDFRVAARLQNATLRLELHLQQKGTGRAQSMARVEDHLQVVWQFQPRNTWPPL